MSNEKEICGNCPNRKSCVELIRTEICPHGLLNIPREEAEHYKAVWRGEEKCCDVCKGSGFVKMKVKK
jgi:hypothetical protein